MKLYIGTVYRTVYGLVENIVALVGQGNRIIVERQD